MSLHTPSRWPWIMLVSRIILFTGIQALFALGFVLVGSSNAWEAASNWWPLVVTIANLICIGLLVWLFKQEDRRFWDIYRVQKAHIKSDLLALLGILIILGPVAFLPNTLLAQWLFGDPQRALDLLLRPLPLWAALASLLLFPVTQGLAEIATYFSYVMPKFESQGMQPWLAVALPSLFLALQHITVPLLFNVPFIAWRGLMFMPFAFLVGIVMHWRPRLLPYLAVIHILMDMSFAAMHLGIAY